MGKTGLTLGFERIDKMTPSIPTQDETDYQASISPYVNLRENYKLFWTTTYGWVFPSSSDPTRQNVESITSEVGISGQITPAFTGSLSAGYGLSHLYPNGVLPAQNFGGISSSMSGSYTHPLHPNTTYSISAYHSPGITAVLSSSSIQEVTGVTFSLAHRLNRELTLAPVVQYENIQSLGASSTHETEDLISVGMGITHQFTQHFSLTIQYQYADRMSNLPDQSYDSTVITVTAHYAF